MDVFLSYGIYFLYISNNSSFCLFSLSFSSVPAGYIKSRTQPVCAAARCLISVRFSGSVFSASVPHLPIQILAVTDSGGANALFSSQLTHQLITEGNHIADRLQAHFMTSTSTCQQKSAFYLSFFKEVSRRTMTGPGDLFVGLLGFRGALTTKVIMRPELGD